MKHATPKFLYIADPMCSWCYAFMPELAQLLKQVPHSQLDIIVGGLRAHHQKILSDDEREHILAHWRRVHQITNLPFDWQGLNKKDFIYNTEPACRALVAVKLLNDGEASPTLLQVFHALQQAFYAEGQDITQSSVIANVTVKAVNEIEGEGALDEDSFLETFHNPATLQETDLNFEQVRQWGVRGYPALYWVSSQGLCTLASGFTKAHDLIQDYEAYRDAYASV